MKKTLLSLVSFFLLISFSQLHATIELGSPIITSSVNSLSDFKYTVGGGPSVEQAFTVSAQNLTSNLVVSAPTNYEISPISGASFVSMNSIAIAHSAGTVSDIILYVRLKSGLSVNSYIGDISITSSGATTKIITLSGNVTNPPLITTSVVSITGLSNFYDVGQSIVKSFEVSGTDLKSGITIAAPYNFEISKTSGSGFTSSSISLPLSGSGIAPTTIYVRLYPYTYPVYDYSGNLTLSSTGAETKTVSLTARSSYKPNIVVSTNTISGINYFTGSGPSAQQSFTLNANYLIDNLTVTAPTNFEISTIGGSGFNGQSSITFNATNYSLATTTIYVRLKAGLIANNYSENLTCTTSYGSTRTIALSGSVTNQPMLIVTGSPLGDLNYNLNTGPSVEKSFTISGSSLSSLVFIYAPINFEISTTSGSAFSASNSIILPQSGGNVSLTTIYVRLKAGLNAGNYSENVTVASTGATNQSVALSGMVANPNAIITLSKNSISNIDYIKGSGPSANQSFNVNASGLTNDAIIATTSNYEISTNPTSGFNNTLTLNQLNGTITSTTIYVRLKSGLNVASYAGSISIDVAGSPTQIVSLNGNVTIPVGINLSETSFSGMDYNQGAGPSVEKSFLISGSAFTSVIIVTAPTNFELSTNSGASFSATSQLILQPVNGIVNETTIYVRLKSGLSNATYQGDVSVSSSGYTTKNISLTGAVITPITLLQDNAYYEPRNNGLIYLQNKWLFSKNLGNYNNTSDLLGNTSTVRSMTVRNGKMLFCSRSAGNQIVSVDGVSGVRSTLTLASNVFTYMGRNKANTADSVYLTPLACNDIKVDAGGNVLVGNLTTSGTLPYQIWKIDLATGNGSLLIDQKDLATLFPGKSMRFDYFNVTGNVNGSAMIYAVCASPLPVKEMFRWTITNGIASSTPEIIPLNMAQDAIFGTAVIVQPIDNENFWIDGDKTFPFIYNINSGYTDSFKNYSVITDSVTMVGNFWKMSTNVNGLKEFKIGDETFLIVGATSYTSSAMYPSSTFRIFKYAKNDLSIKNLQCLWTFPQAGMGTTVNSYRTALPEVEVNGDKAKIYVYYGENGYGVYELVSKSGGGYTSEKMTTTDFIVHVIGNNIVASEELSQMEVYTVTGQLLKSVKNTMSVTKPAGNGVYIVKTKTTAGLVQSAKIVVK